MSVDIENSSVDFNFEKLSLYTKGKWVVSRKCEIVPRKVDILFYFQNGSDMSYCLGTIQERKSEKGLKLIDYLYKKEKGLQVM